jgi:hypothetical protein
MTRPESGISVYLFVLIFSFVTCAFAQRADGKGTFGSAKVKTETLSVYSKMSKMSPVVKKLNQGDIVTIEFEIENADGEWCGIREGGQITASGYVLCEYLEREGSPAKKEGQFYESTDTVELIRAAGQGDMMTLKGLLDKGVDVNEKDKEFGWTALMAGALSGRTGIIRILLAKGAHVDAKDNFGWTPLMIASRSGHTDAVCALLDAGAHVNAKTNTGYTGLMAAAEKGHPDTVKLLLTRGADVHARDKFGWRAITLAERRGYEDIVHMLKEAGEKE